MPQAPASGAPRILPNGLKSLVGPKPKPEFMVKEGKRPEVGAFDLEIVWHNDEEYHRWEYWAKQEGLLGKVWDPPPIEEDDSVPLKDGSGAGARKSMRNRRSTNVRFAGGSPTTNTKAALDDVFGMFNETVMVDDLLQDGDDDDDNETPASRPPVPSTPAPLIALGGSIKSASFTPLVSQPTKPTALATTTPRFEVARDENAPAPKSVAKTPAPKFSVFQESKTPGPSTTPGLAPKFSVFSDSRAENAAITPGVRLGSSVARDPDPARATAVFGGPSKTPTAKFSVFQEDGQEQIPVTPGMGLRTSAAPLALKPASTTSTVSSPPEEDSFDDDGPIDNIPSSPAGVLSLTASTKPKDPKTNPGPPQTTPLSYRDSPSASGLRASDSRQRLESPRGGDVFTDDVARVEGEESPAHESEATADNQEDGDAQDEIDEVSENEENDPYDYIPPREYEIRGGVAIMTPITERTLEYETSKSIRISQGSSRDSISHVLDGLNSSPYGPGKHSSGRPSLTTNFRRRSSIRPRPSTIREHSEEHEGGDEADAGISGATPVNPFLPEMIEGMIDAVWSNLDLSRYRDFSDRESQYLERFESHSRKLARSQLSKSQQDSPAPLAFTLGEEEYNLIEKIGEGGFGAVFLAEDQSIKDLLADDPETTQEGSELVAIKVVRPSMLWEYAVLHVLRSSLPPGPILSSIISPHAFYHFSNESHLLMEYSNQGTLLDAVNNASKIGISTQDTHGIDELLIMFFAIELIKIIKCLHGEHFIHGDLKIDNCLLRLADPVEIPLDTIYDPEGEGGWSERGVKLIDFGRTIDAGLFDPEQTFIGNWPTDARDCVEMREGRPWTYQTDYAGLAGIVYCMMFGKYIETVAGPTTAKGRPRYKLATPLKRYWQTELWSRLFDVLLNPTLAREDGTLPLVDELAAIEDTMANWLAANCEKKGKSLKKMLGQMYQFSKNRRSTSGRK
ncbi:hypothetical protein DL93DRAFT_2141053 [Clavulina sp. PMI_390]|nr:hypothetical protein DL93DRAFT_2141053 [Clavulina sp. PMI_390]